MTIRPVFLSDLEDSEMASIQNIKEAAKKEVSIIKDFHEKHFSIETAVLNTALPFIPEIETNIKYQGVFFNGDSLSYEAKHLYYIDSDMLKQNIARIKKREKAMKAKLLRRKKKFTSSHTF